MNDFALTETLPGDWRTCAVQLLELQSTWSRYPRERIAPDIATAFGVLCRAGFICFEGDISIGYEPRTEKRLFKRETTATRDTDRIHCVWQGEVGWIKSGHQHYSPFLKPLMDLNAIPAVNEGWKINRIGDHPRYVALTEDGVKAKRYLQEQPTNDVIGAFIECLARVFPCDITLTSDPLDEPTAPQAVTVNVQNNFSETHIQHGLSRDDKNALHGVIPKKLDGIAEQMQASRAKPKAATGKSKKRGRKITDDPAAVKLIEKVIKAGQISGPKKIAIEAQVYDSDGEPDEPMVLRVQSKLRTRRNRSKKKSDPD